MPTTRIPPDFKEFLKSVDAHNARFLLIGSYWVVEFEDPLSTSGDERCRLSRKTTVSSIDPSFDSRPGNFQIESRSTAGSTLVLENYLFSLESKHPQYGPSERVPSVNSHRREHAGGASAGEDKVIRYVNVPFALNGSERFRAFDGGSNEQRRT